ncbi:MAG TPA: hypothetical protein VKZ79_16780 [Alphaproteobacteria bacterium]|nr:hypothetical protein [Alphaproteobacteria bacterium]
MFGLMDGSPPAFIDSRKPADGFGPDRGQQPTSTTTYTLTTGADTIADGTGNADIVATSATLSTGDVISPAGWHNTLTLSGAGTFDLGAPATFSNISLVKGDASADQTITLRDGFNTNFVGGDGNDTITSLSGNDHIRVGNGNNIITAGSGNVSIMVGSGDNQITAGSGQTFVMLGSGTNTVTGSTGSLFVTATDGADTITAGPGQTTIFTGSGSDTVNAGSGSLTIFTGRGTTTIAGGTGAETIIVGHGTTNATLSTGTDTLKIGWGTGTANVSNFVHGIDTIDVSALHFGSYSTLVSDATITTTSTGLTIQFAHGPTINLVGVSSVSSSDFTF